MHIHQLFNACIHFIFPPSEDARRVEKMTEGYVRSLYWKEKVEDIYTLAHFSHPDIRALIHEAKFHHNKRACALLNILFLKFLDEHPSSDHVVIPIPLSRPRLRERGYNQVQEILMAGDYSDHLSIQTKMLVRTRNTRPQTELLRNARLRNIQNAFEVKEGSRVNGKHILLVDDVTTTGATLRAAKETLLPYGPASIVLVALAH